MDRLFHLCTPHEEFLRILKENKLRKLKRAASPRVRLQKHAGSSQTEGETPLDELLGIGEQVKKTARANTQVIEINKNDRERIDDRLKIVA
jgi:hypothetical protein